MKTGTNCEKRLIFFNGMLNNVVVKIKPTSSTRGDETIALFKDMINLLFIYVGEFVAVFGDIAKEFITGRKNCNRYDVVVIRQSVSNDFARLNDWLLF